MSVAQPDRTALLYAATTPDSVAAWARRYLEWLVVHQYARGTVAMVRQDLAHFHAWCLERGIGSPREVTKPVLERFQRYLFFYRKESGEPLALRRQSVCLVHLKGFFRWLAKQNHIGSNPASDLDLPRLPPRPLKQPMTLEQVETLLALPNLADPLGLRDRVMLEVFYSTGIRRAELARLALYDVDAPGGSVFVRQGKGRKDRVVPIGERALAWLAKYQTQVRPQYVIDPNETALFLSADGHALSLDAITARMRPYFREAGVRGGTCHLLRHTMATQMLEHGADIRFIQEMLGHAKLDTTQQYTHVSIAKLKAVHAATHPGAKLERRGEDRDVTAD